MRLLYVNELRFWRMPLKSACKDAMNCWTNPGLPSPRRVHVVLDWDGTITTKDTLHLVSDIGYQRNAESKPPFVSWSKIVKAYLDDYALHERAYRPSKENRRTAIEESAWLASLSAVENRSIKRVEAAGIFKAVREEDIRRAGHDAIANRTIELRNGFMDLLSHIFGDKLAEDGSSIELSVLSVNWSALFIRSCLERSVEIARGLEPQLGRPQPDHRVEIIQRLLIRANEIQGIGTEEGSSGLLSPSAGSGIRTSRDKLYLLQELRETTKSIIIYIGDSATDFDALIYADIGICIRNEPMGTSQKELADTLQRVGIPARPLDSVTSHQIETKDSKKFVWCARDLEQVARLIPRIYFESD
jgi:hypothetical protein